MAEYSKGLYNTGIRTCNEAVVTTAYILTVQLSWGYSHILAIQVCAAGNGMVFKPFQSRIGSSNHRKLVWYRVPFNGIVGKKLKSKTLSIFSLVQGNKINKIGQVKGRTFANPAAHPHPNYTRVPPGPTLNMSIINTWFFLVPTAG